MYENDIDQVVIVPKLKRNEHEQEIKENVGIMFDEIPIFKILSKRYSNVSITEDQN